MGLFCCKESRTYEYRNPNDPEKPFVDVPFQIQQIQLITETTDKSFLQSYQLKETIDIGRQCEVKKIMNWQTQILKAGKIIQKSFQNQIEQQTEIEMMKKLDHPNIVKMVEYFQDEEKYYIVMEILEGGNLTNRIMTNKKFNENEAANYMKQILSGVAYIHSMGFAHNKIEPENLVFDSFNEDANLKIIDFGNPQQKIPTIIQGQEIGPAILNFIAPEIFLGEGNYSKEKIDIWNCGIILYLMLFGEPPFKGRTDKETIQMIQLRQFNFPPGNTISEQAKILIKKLLTLDYNQRISAQEALQDQWLSDNDQMQPTLEKLTYSKDILKNLSSFQKSNSLQNILWQYLTMHMTTKMESTKLLKTFRAMDQDGDGFLTREELIQGYKKIHLYEEDIENIVDSILQQADTNQSGVLDYSEFLTYSVDREKMITLENLQTMFKIIDRNDDDVIDASELEKIFHKSYQGPENKIIWLELISLADENMDGKISLDEFQNMMFKFL